jgi:hypothetical protein
MMPCPAALATCLPSFGGPPIIAKLFAGAIAAASLLLLGSGGALAQESAFVPGSAVAPVAAESTHRVGDAFDYTVRGSMTQSILAHDVLGQKVDQPGTPTALDGREHIAIKQISDSGITLHRSGLIVAVVANAKPQQKAGKSWTLVRDDGSIARDTGNLGGVFLLPLPFLGGKSLNAGSDLQVGSRWTDKLGTKLYGMTARPTMDFQITGQRLVLGVDVYEVDAEGSVPMKEPVFSNSGEALGYAIGTAHITVHGQYDHVNHRMVSMEVDVEDSLRLSGATKHAQGTVGDHQHYVVELDPASLATTPLQTDTTTIEAPVTH